MNKLVLIHFILSSYAEQLQQYWNEIKKKITISSKVFNTHLWFNLITKFDL